ncbi:MAG: hypothetical protein A2655_02525 [Candidatus Yanofskybacteria bacterium RIFCSPHIGHO2_01_FULL_43_42]|uniref:Triosephosphate isomerase n=1 Tax=Candidatus Yanofskybacteria bacterium RIFCSPLOWO2_01_FULL_43_22 TaxID=1802695 RepID=A0A1F8GDL1_9BACT|nr:MAG: hypothetical protein A2655_02525 [Candidatus Yanofskybacteria bacterium RIFCSPHIGHO2_01_FULL_43_42]OGN13404.1 MAG: hypothetical protein A3D48_00800 [Candidatus Yanofskybacteria bacterium RIFCSPHIGHO2_02_FULL_43_17]OGN23457.1 MAG: hypothetical protein A3A13_03540 [Candidatus Yanofskybacteria bacterium RIFCSPLOWO2_01_FULL_43_22]
MSKKLIISNWKNHPDSLAEAGQILDTVDEFSGSLGEKELSLVFCPPFVFVEEVGKILKTSHLIHHSELGAQDISVDDNMALTGEVSGPILRRLGVRYVIIGHSERRWKLGESDEIVNKKLKAALRNEFVPIVCLGERARDNNFSDFLEEQTLSTFAGLNSDEVARCLIAYEPIWAISTTPDARPDTPESALASISIIKNTLLANGYSLMANRYLYGGSVTSRNARDFLGSEGIGGVLVGGASIKRDEFVKILAIAAELQ